MADILVGVTNSEITAAGEYQLGEASAGIVSSWVIAFTDHSSSGGSITIKGRVLGQKNAAFVATGYFDYADYTNKTAAITGAALIRVDAAGLDIQIDCTAISSGGIYFDAHPVLG